MTERERFVVLQIVTPPDIVDDEPAINTVWGKMREKAATGVPERPGWRIAPDEEPAKQIEFSRFVGDDDHAAMLPASREDADVVILRLLVWAERPAAPDHSTCGNG